MKVEISVPEVVEIFKEIQEQPERLFEMIRVDIKENVGEYLPCILESEGSTKEYRKNWAKLIQKIHKVDPLTSHQ